MKKISLGQQMDEIRRELAQRREVYPRLVNSGKMRESVAAYQTHRLEAVLETLAWLAANELTIKQRLAS